jgi:hypothetical protein
MQNHIFGLVPLRHDGDFTIFSGLTVEHDRIFFAQLQVRKTLQTMNYMINFLVVFQIDHGPATNVVNLHARSGEFDKELMTNC